MKPDSYKPKSRFIQNKSSHTHYIDWQGKGPTTVLIHGDMRTSRSFDQVAKKLSSDNHVLAMDLLGHGNSSWTESGYRFADRSADIGNFVTKTDLNEITAVSRKCKDEVYEMDHLKIMMEALSQVTLLNNLLTAQCQVGPIKR